MKRMLAAIGVAAVAGTTLLSAASAEQPAPQPPAADLRPPQAGPGPRGEMPRPGPRGPREFRLAERLSAAETLVGIRANQLDAWRDYTNALLALFEPPAPPQADADSGKAFAHEERMIRAITDRAARAATLDKSIAALKTVLTPDQLDKLAKLEMEARPPRPGPGGPGRWGGPDGHRFGFNGGPAGWRGRPDGQPPFAPGEGRGMSPAAEPGPGAPDDGAQPDFAPTPG